MIIDEQDRRARHGLRIPPVKRIPGALLVKMDDGRSRGTPLKSVRGSAWAISLSEQMAFGVKLTNVPGNRLPY
ncbi:hypothetical protein ALO43_101362 [Pseudomonas tremae]|uniref:Uncharacterized protein n=2 Tax=Pseudomonas syringae group TaxID=136849 RepID=A0A3M3QN56_PSECA|nr:hypothetical protein ALO83_103579 [Pseudomonas cannabina pv. alisalensis]KPY97216.1 hypothetical protein ALO36_103662 [Pseudomonas syringae pv. tomato]KPY97426.1 hypothetical protein ALO43_101362 [Pseudomonas tremae]RMM33965.1 hypothetical protein ALQ80_101129 [Pseudomonas coronafaciens pv. oryzae]RMN29551.1 hypothetical protein ALQ62_101259 [Pseudomonas coronafaciens pv. zizaniae]RMN85325.1 hypothetical protein ALQ53_103345 [Pseudomonas cannabina]RMP65050.1 hypothetical protein ALQ19_1023